MNYDTDAVILGGGPAGASCAIYLQHAGISNLIIEKQSFPREKTCAGMLTAKTYRQLSKLINTALGTDVPDGIFCDTASRLKLYYKDEMLTDSALKSELRLVKRRDFDNYLIETYKKTGGALLEDRTVKEYRFDENRLTLDNGDTVKYKYLIGADGALSPCRKALGYKSPVMAFCTETFVPKTDAFGDGAARIYFGYLKKGYLWVFPHGDGLCVGLGDEYNKNTDLSKVLKDFLCSNGFECDHSRIKGAFFPYGEHTDQSRGTSNAILIGDAGGFVDRITGEGLYFALSTGEAAANAVIKSTAGSVEFKKEFLSQTEKYSETVRQSAKKGNGFYKDPVMSIFRKKIKGKNGLVSYYCENQISEYNYSYSDLPKLFADYKIKKR